MNNKLDTFNKDKVKCLKCKEYYDKKPPIYPAGYSSLLCEYCAKKWDIFKGSWYVSKIFFKSNNSILDASECFKNWCKDEQT
jgi:transposase-like protein